MIRVANPTDLVKFDFKRKENCHLVLLRCYFGAINAYSIIVRNVRFSATKRERKEEQKHYPVIVPPKRCLGIV